MPFTGSTVPPFLRYGVSHSLLSDTRRLTANEKDPSASLPMTIREECVSHTLFLCMMHEISIPYTVISSAARNLPCTLLFLAPFAKVFPFSAITHTALYRCARKIEGFARDDDTGIALSQHILYTMRRISPYHNKKAPARAGAFCVRKTYLPNCASMVPAATAVPITPATFGPMACISR